MTEPALTALTQLAEAAYARSDPTGAHDKWPGMLGVITDPDRSQVMALAARDCMRELNQAVSVLSGEPGLSIFHPANGQLDPCILYPGGSIRQPFSEIVVALLTSAAQRYYYLRQELTLESFLAAVLENYQQMIRLAQGDRVKGYALIGYTGIIIPEGARVKTPWGILNRAPSNFRVGLGFNRTTAILGVRANFKLGVSREEYPQQMRQVQVLPPRAGLARQILPIAFALATATHSRCTPMATFYAQLLPVAALTSFSAPETFLPLQASPKPSEQEIQAAEKWMKTLVRHRSGSLEVAHRRLVSAIAQRVDKADALIDATIAWESLVGTGSEISYRVSAALAKLLRQEYPSRKALRQRLGELYGLRSAVVHGNNVNTVTLTNASTEAIEIGLEALRALYERPTEWLAMESQERAEMLILDD